MVCGSHKFGPPEFPRDDRPELSDSSLFPYKINLGIPRNSLEFLKNSLEFLRIPKNEGVNFHGDWDTNCRLVSTSLVSTESLSCAPISQFHNHVQ